jgi:TolB-like protein/tetratricopeptide (TPR) repeat protein
MRGRVEHYRILDRIGRGGMGEIYAAHDDRLDRVVALKFIHPDRLGDEDTRRRFLREARAAAALSHPFICNIYEVLESEGQPIIVMEHVCGQTVLERTAGGPLGPADVCRLGREIAEALSAAHVRGIIHRDVSASNVMITTDGHVKLMDFGLAHVADTTGGGAPTATFRAQPGTSGPVLMGTPAYMAPELLAGGQATPQSDLYAAGVVLYRMATARMPFGDRVTPASLAEVLVRPPVPPRESTPGVPWALERVILRLLEKDPAARFPSADSLAAALADPAPTAMLGSARSVAVLPFKPLGHAADDRDLGLGLADATITDLAVVRSLLVRPTTAILPYHDRAVDPVTAGRELSVDAVVTGSFQRAGHRMRVTVQLVSTSDGRPLWGTKIDTSLDDVFRLQDEVSRQIVRALEVELTHTDEQRMQRAVRPPSPASEPYLRGRVLMLRESIESASAAVEAFEDALQLDPQFAPAYAGLASAYSRIAFSFLPEGDYYDRAVRMCTRALEIDPNLPEARYMLGRLAWTPQSSFNHEEAIRQIADAIAARPSMNEAVGTLGMIVFHLSLLNEAEALIERAVAIDPNDQYAAMHIAFCRYLAGDWQVACEAATAAWRQTPSAWSGYQLALTELHLGRLAEARRTIDRAARLFPGDVLFYPLEAVLAAFDGDEAGVRRQIDLTVRHRKEFGHYHHAQYDVACALSLVRAQDEAMRWLEEAAGNGFPCYVFFERDPWLAALRAHPRFHPLMRKLRDECDRYAELFRSAMGESFGSGAG